MRYASRTFQVSFRTHKEMARDEWNAIFVNASGMDPHSKIQTYMHNTDPENKSNSTVSGHTDTRAGDITGAFTYPWEEPGKPDLIQVRR